MSSSNALFTRENFSRFARIALLALLGATALGCSLMPGRRPRVIVYERSAPDEEFFRMVRAFASDSMQHSILQLTTRPYYASDTGTISILQRAGVPVDSNPPPPTVYCRDSQESKATPAPPVGTQVRVRVVPNADSTLWTLSVHVGCRGTFPGIVNSGWTRTAGWELGKRRGNWRIARTFSRTVT